MNALERVNTKLLVNHIQKSIGSYLKSFVFEPKDDITKTQIKNGISNFLDDKCQDYIVEVTGEEERELDWIEKVLGRNYSIFLIKCRYNIKTVEQIHVAFMVK